MLSSEGAIETYKAEIRHSFSKVSVCSVGARIWLCLGRVMIQVRAICERKPKVVTEFLFWVRVGKSWKSLLMSPVVGV